MKQLLLNISSDTPPSFNTFVVGRHAELVQLLQTFAKHNADPYCTVKERAAYLWGASGAGKTHLLHALANAPGACYIDALAPDSAFEYTQETKLYLVDDCQKMNDAQQIALFNLYNQIKEHQAFFVAAGSKAPAVLAVREDLRTRLGWGLIYQIHELTDEEKIAALNKATNARGIAIPDPVLPYLISHFPRDMPSLSRMVDGLIHFSLEKKRPITLPLLREFVHNNEQQLN